MLMKDLKWSQQTAIALKAMINNWGVVAIFDTGSSGVVISKSCFKRLGLVQDREVNFKITSATNTIWKRGR